MSMRAGIWLNNAFATAKLFMLLTIIGVALMSYRQDTDHRRIGLDHYQQPILELPSIFHDAGSTLTGLSYAIFAYTGVSLEIPFEPRQRQPLCKKLLLPTFFGISLLLILYPLVNMAFYGTISLEPAFDTDPRHTRDVTLTFFEAVLSGTSNNQDTAKNILSLVLAFSALGNILAVTWTAARLHFDLRADAFLPMVELTSGVQVALLDHG
ncbi:amino acid/polyamine transporter I [Rhypophila decipiens]|uniref:Amino acid/polyamine transporter I n=1 Tax=Rhypophila decipiens TaxID=261697 RepID=A0AAN6YC86_9PEZI|nr:amino acid/polyamine transporter I [Rhypophila decipiens]